MQMPIIMDGEEYLNTTEAKDFLGISSWSTFGDVIRRNNITPKQRGFGRQRYYAKSWLQDILKLRDVPQNTKDTAE